MHWAGFREIAASLSSGDIERCVAYMPGSESKGEEIIRLKHSDLI
jgi:hypothetical protein